MSSLVNLPTTFQTVTQKFVVEPLGGPQLPLRYLDRFPDALYLKTPESHLVRYMSALVGPAGVGSLRKQYLEARLLFEEHGIELFDIERFYASPFAFGRILDEIYDDDPYGLLTHDQWTVIKSKDASYRSRAIDFLNGVRAGNSPMGMRLIARSGLGHDVEIIENYRYLFDVHSDDPLGLTYVGQTLSTEEMIVVPRRDHSVSEVKRVAFNPSATTGNFLLSFNGYSTGLLSIDAGAPLFTGGYDGSIAYFADALAVQAALWSLPSIGAGNVRVQGGPGFISGNAQLADYLISFTNDLGNRDVPDITAISNLTGGGVPYDLTITTETEGVDASDEIATIPPRDQHSLFVALDRIKAVTTIPTVFSATGLRVNQIWTQVQSSSAYTEVIRYVTGQSGALWPDLDSTHWIEKAIEKPGPRTAGDLQHHYQGFHNISKMYSYTEAAILDVAYLTDVTTTAKYPSQHVGRFTKPQTDRFSFLADVTDDALVFTPDRALADYAEPLLVTSTANDQNVTTQFIQGIYPMDYASLPGVPEVQYKDEQYWASEERFTGDEYLEIDLGHVQAVNFLTFEVTRKPVSIDISYDLLDAGNTRSWLAVTPEPHSDFATTITYDPSEQAPWSYSEYHFTNSLGRILFTRYIRIKFSRISNDFLFDPTTSTNYPWSIEVRNLRLGRNVAP